MARNSITLEQVIGAAESIQAEGGKATARAVRDRLGTGSMGTVNQMLQTWRGERETVAPKTVSTMPASLQQAIMQFVFSQVEEGRELAMSELADRQKTVVSLEEEIERMAAQVEAQDGLLQQMRDQASHNTGLIAQLRADLAKAEEKAAKESELVTVCQNNLARAELRLERMHQFETSLAEVQKELSEERTVRVHAEKAAAVFEEKVASQGRLLDEIATTNLRERQSYEGMIERLKAEVDAAKAANVKGSTKPGTKPAGAQVSKRTRKPVTSVKAGKVGITQAD